MNGWRVEEKVGKFKGHAKQIYMEVEEKLYSS
jgi:hypothetical protein